MTTGEFIDRFNAVEGVMSDDELKAHIAHNKRDDDLTICIGELSELILELTRFQRDKQNYDDLLQELSHVQWVVWRLQEMFCISDVVLRKAVQASFR